MCSDICPSSENGWRRVSRARRLGCDRIKSLNRPPSGSVLFGQRLRLSFSVRIETRLLALRPGCSLLRAADVPIGTAALQYGAQVEAQLLHRRPAEEPVPIVD